MNNPVDKNFEKVQEPVNVPDTSQTAEIEKNQLEQFYMFLKEKEKDIEIKINSMPKYCRKVSDKREKLQLQKDLDEVVNEINYVQGMLNKP